MINILHIAKTYNAGAPIRLVQCQNKYSNGQIKSNLITLNDFSGNQRLGGLKYDKDYMYNKQCMSTYQELFDKADFIHIHGLIEDKKFKELFNRDLFSKKVILHIHNGFMKVKDNRYYKKLVVGQYQPRFFPDAFIVPNIIDIYDKRLMPLFAYGKDLNIFYSYSNSDEQNGSWMDKGARFIEPILKQLEKEENIKSFIYTNTPYNELMSIKKGCHVCIDDICTGSFHLTSLEALSQGLLVIDYVDNLTEKFLRSYIVDKDKPLPFIYANKDNLKEVILNIKKMGLGELFIRQEQNREWMRRNFDPERLINEFYAKEIYK